MLPHRTHSPARNAYSDVRAVIAADIATQAGLPAMLRIKQYRQGTLDWLKNKKELRESSFVV